MYGFGCKVLGLELRCKALFCPQEPVHPLTEAASTNCAPDSRQGSLAVCDFSARGNMYSLGFREIVCNFISLKLQGNVRNMVCHASKGA